MKKSIPYLVGAIGVIALLIILIESVRRSERQINERVTLRTKDKIPYGYFAAYKLLPGIFPKAEISLDKAEPMQWATISNEDSNQAVILSCSYFYPDRSELDQLAYFASKGNHIFIIAAGLSQEVDKFFEFSSSFYVQDEGFSNNYGDSLSLQLAAPPFAQQEPYVYPGKRMNYTATLQDSAHGIVLGRNSTGRPDFYYFKVGKGSIILHLSPLAFSNYFLLHKNNVRYYSQALSVIPSTVNRVDWNEYYLSRQPKNEEPNFLKVLFRYRSFRWALITAAFSIFVFALLYMRRRQRMIPVISKPSNESLDFIKTIGRLYYDKLDHTDLALKMSVYFLDHVRRQYTLQTHLLDADFATMLHAKSGYGQEEIEEIVRFISYLHDHPRITEKQLTAFHKQLEHFYQNT